MGDHRGQGRADGLQAKAHPPAHRWPRSGVQLLQDEALQVFRRRNRLWHAGYSPMVNPVSVAPKLPRAGCSASTRRVYSPGAGMGSRPEKRLASPA